jgi:uncharacterized protein YbaP (TraB family)
MQRLLSQILAAGLLLGSANAAEAPPVPQWSRETVVVNAHRQGPLFWRVSRGNAEVWILAVVGPLPEDLAWDHSQLEELIGGAKRVLLLPRVEVGFFEGTWFLLTRRSTLELPNDEHLEDVLDAPLKARFVSAREKLHRDADRYEDLLPAVAGMRLYADFLSDAKLTGKEPLDTIKSLADDKDVPAMPIATYEALPIVKDVSKMSDADSRACLKSALNDIDAENLHQAEAAKAWAVGDLAGMKRNYSESTILTCLLSVPRVAALWDKSVTDMTNTVNGALAEGGRTVMVTSLGTLLRKGGVLDRLRASGATVEMPE